MKIEITSFDPEKFWSMCLDLLSANSLIDDDGDMLEDSPGNIISVVKGFLDQKKSIQESWEKYIKDTDLDSDDLILRGYPRAGGSSMRVSWLFFTALFFKTKAYDGKSYEYSVKIQTIPFSGDELEVPK